MFNWLMQMFRRPHSPSRLLPESQFTVIVDDDRILCQQPSGKTESVAWNDLESVTVETNDTGPWQADVWWILTGDSSSPGCTIPQGATGEEPLLDRLQKLPGFDNEQFIAAMSCTENRTFVCWRRNPG